jgi:hypothetical protein
MENELKIIQENNIPAESNYDSQVATAKMYPRNVKRAVENMIAIATMDMETAKGCSYTIPRAGGKITGGSIHMAKIIAQNWGNLRIESRVTKITHSNIYSEAIAFDLESNVAIKIESTRKIISKEGKRFNDDMISLTGLVTNSIALRNAVFTVVPKSIIDKVYNEAMKFVVGDLSDEVKLSNQRKKTLDQFKDIYGVSELEILKSLGLNSVQQIKAEQIKVLFGMAQSLKDGEFSVDEIFDRGIKTKAPNPHGNQEQKKNDENKLDLK